MPDTNPLQTPAGVAALIAEALSNPPGRAGTANGLIHTLADALAQAERERADMLVQAREAGRKLGRTERERDTALSMIEKVRAVLGPNVIYAPDEDDEYLVDEAASYMEGADHVRDVVLALLSEAPAAEQPRHFAPYGSTNALCEETVPRATWGDRTDGEYADDRFTVKRDRTTCPECLRRMAGTPVPAAEPSGDDLLEDYAESIRAGLRVARVKVEANDPAPSEDERDALIDAINRELEWEWDEVPTEHIPSSREILGEIADRVLSAGFHRNPAPVTKEAVRRLIHEANMILYPVASHGPHALIDTDSPDYTPKLLGRLRDALVALHRDPAPVTEEQVKAAAIREAVEEFENNVGPLDFAEQSTRAESGRPARWTHAEEAWERQGPFMDWLRNRADAIEAARETGR